LRPRQADNAVDRRSNGGLIKVQLRLGHCGTLRFHVGPRGLGLLHGIIALLLADRFLLKESDVRAASIPA
jgi:hypothetical protein